MSQIDVPAEWQELCEEHEAARAAYFQAFAAVNHKIAAIAQGASQANPMEAELAEFEVTWRAWEDVRKRIDVFVKQYA